MTAPVDPPATPDEHEPSRAPASSVPLPFLSTGSARRRGRPGRPLGPITPDCGSAHRAWLEPLRETYLASGLTMSQLGSRLPLSKSKVSELMSGRMYPRWEILYPLALVLGMPYAPLYRLWAQAALETQNRSQAWVKGSAAGVTVTVSAPAPVEHRAFRKLTEDQYHRYANIFLPDDRGELAVTDTFDQLWLSWPRALSSPDVRRFAWRILRATVMSRTPHLDGRPEFSDAAFDTDTMRTLTDENAIMKQLAETHALFKAMGRLPANQLDVMVLSRVCGMPPEMVCEILGVPLATVRSDERHATRFLDLALCPPTDNEGNPA